MAGSEILKSVNVMDDSVTACTDATFAVPQSLHSGFRGCTLLQSWWHVLLPSLTDIRQCILSL